MRLLVTLGLNVTLRYWMGEKEEERKEETSMGIEDLLALTKVPPLGKESLLIIF